MYLINIKTTIIILNVINIIIKNKPSFLGANYSTWHHLTQIASKEIVVIPFN